MRRLLLHHRLRLLLLVSLLLHGLLLLVSLLLHVHRLLLLHVYRLLLIHLRLMLHHHRLSVTHVLHRLLLLDEHLRLRCRSRRIRVLLRSRPSGLFLTRTATHSDLGRKQRTE